MDRHSSKPLHRSPVEITIESPSSLLQFQLLKQNEKWLRISLALKIYGTKALIILLKKKYKISSPKNLHSWIVSAESKAREADAQEPGARKEKKLFNIRKEFILKDLLGECHIDCHKGSTSCCNKETVLDDLDITSLNQIFRNIEHIIPNNVLPQKKIFDFKKFDKIHVSTITKKRDNLAHYKQNENEFEKDWKTISIALIHCGLSNEERKDFNYLKNGSLDPYLKEKVEYLEEIVQQLRGKLKKNELEIKEIMEFLDKQKREDLYPDNKYNENLLKDLMDNQRILREVTARLDLEEGWEKLLNELALTVKIDKKDIYEEQRKKEYGGGSPSLAFLKKLNIEQRIPITDFIKKSDGCKLPDVKEYLSSLLESKGNIKLMKDLTYDETRKLANMLYVNEKGKVLDWKYFASEYGYKKLTISILEAEKKILDQWSPTEGVLQRLLQVYPRYSLSDFVNVLEKMERNDIIEEIFPGKNPQPRKYIHRSKEGGVKNDATDCEDDGYNVNDKCFIDKPIQEVDEKEFDYDKSP